MKEKTTKKSLWLILSFLILIIAGLSALLYNTKNIPFLEVGQQFFTGELKFNTQQTEQNTINEQLKNDQEKLNKLSTSCLDNKKCVNTISNPIFVPKVPFIHDNDEVIGVFINKIARAYPFKILNWHEAVNDSIGNTPLLITYSPLCSHAEVFNRILDQKTPQFAVADKVENSNSVLYEPESKTYWSQWSGQKIAGISKTDRLEKIQFTRTTYLEWKLKYPQTSVLAPPKDSGYDYGNNPFELYASTPDLYFPMDNYGDPTLNKTLIWYWPFTKDQYAFVNDEVYTKTGLQSTLKDYSRAYYACAKAFYPNLKPLTTP